jgi:hypothetical protein
MNKQTIIDAFRQLSGNDRKEVYEAISRAMGGPLFQPKPQTKEIELCAQDLKEYVKNNNDQYMSIFRGKQHCDKILSEWAEQNSGLPFEDKRHLFMSVRRFVNDYNFTASHKEVQRLLKQPIKKDTEKEKKEYYERMKNEILACLEGAQPDQMKVGIYVDFLVKHGKITYPLDFEDRIQAEVKTISGGILREKGELFCKVIATSKIKRELFNEYLKEKR